MTQQLELTGALAGVSQGVMIRPIFALISGLPGVGKTTLASQAPSPIFLGLGNETYQKNVARFPKAQTLADFFGQVRGVASETHPFKTVVLDTLDALEVLVWKQVCAEGNVTSIEDYQGGFGHGRIRAGEIWRAIMIELEQTIAPRFHTLLIGHTTTKTFQDPNQASGYDRYQLRIDDRAAAVIRETVDLMLFCMFRTDLVRNKKHEVRATTDGARVMFTEFRPAFFDAKNRFNLPFEMPLTWGPLAKAIKAYYEQAKPETQTETNNGN
jgi:hypothetical protein